jgi:hypothetical protein
LMGLPRVRQLGERVADLRAKPPVPIFDPVASCHARREVIASRFLSGIPRKGE